MVEERAQLLKDAGKDEKGGVGCGFAEMDQCNQCNRQVGLLIQTTFSANSKIPCYQVKSWLAERIGD